MKKIISTFFLIDFLILSLIITPIAQVQAASQLYFVHSDHLGSTAVVTDQNGDVVSQNRHYPYGADRTVEGNQEISEKKYTGQTQDRETNLYYYNARYYDPFLGTFVSADPVNDSLNRYAYVNNNPLLLVDPTGNQVIAAIVAGVVAVAYYGSAAGFGIFAGGAVYDIINDHSYTVPLTNIHHDPSPYTEQLAADTKAVGMTIVGGAYALGMGAQVAMPIAQHIDAQTAARSQAPILANSSSPHDTMYGYNRLREPSSINTNAAMPQSIRGEFNAALVNKPADMSRVEVAAGVVHQYVPYNGAAYDPRVVAQSRTFWDKLLGRGPEMSRVVTNAGGGVCLHQSILTSWLAQTAGKASDVVVGTVPGGGRHAFNTFIVGTERYAVDVAQGIVNAVRYSEYAGGLGFSAQYYESW